MVYYSITTNISTPSGATFASTNARIRLVDTTNLTLGSPTPISGSEKMVGFTVNDNTIARNIIQNASQMVMINATSSTSLKATITCGNFGATTNYCSVVPDSTTTGITDPDNRSKIIAIRLN